MPRTPITSLQCPPSIKKKTRMKKVLECKAHPSTEISSFFYKKSVWFRKPSVFLRSSRKLNRNFQISKYGGGHTTVCEIQTFFRQYGKEGNSDRTHTWDTCARRPVCGPLSGKCLLFVDCRRKASLTSLMRRERF